MKSQIITISGKKSELYESNGRIIIFTPGICRKEEKENKEIKLKREKLWGINRYE